MDSLYYELVSPILAVVMMTVIRVANAESKSGLTSFGLTVSDIPAVLEG